MLQHKYSKQMLFYFVHGTFLTHFFVFAGLRSLLVSSSWQFDISAWKYRRETAERSLN